MATISSLGIGSGLDLSGIVTGLVEAERVPTENRLDAKEVDISTQLSAFGALKSSLSLFQGSLSNLKLSSTFNDKAVTNSDSTVFTATAASFADPGSYSVEVTALAKAHSLATSELSAFSSVDDTVGTGTLTIRFGTTAPVPSYSFAPDTSKATQTITVSAENNNTTLSGLKDYINDGDFGMSAAIVNDGNGFRLTLTSTSTGAKNGMEITVTNDGEGSNEDNNGLSQLAYNATSPDSMGQTVQSQDATLKVNGLNITRETNTVSGAIDGVTLNLLKADSGNSVAVNVSANTSKAKSAIEDFVESYNGLIGTINTLTNYNAEENTAGLLIGDFTVRSLSSQLRNAVSTSISQLSSNFNSLSNLGIKTISNGTLELSSTTLDAALANFPDDVASIFAAQGRTEEDGVDFISSTSNTLNGNYAVNITAMATQAEFNGGAMSTYVINDANNEFSLRLDGVVSSTITLTNGDYTNGTQLAAHIQAQINDDANLKAAGAAVQVVYDSINDELDMTSLRYGSESTIDILTIDTLSSNIGFSTVSGLKGVDVAGTINGLTATGVGQTLTSAAGNSNGLALSVTSGIPGTRGSMTFTNGISKAIDSLLSSFVDTNGLISSREEGFKSQLEKISEERVALDLRISSLEARLVKQFSALDGLIASFNTTSQFLTQQLAALPKPNSTSNN